MILENIVYVRKLFDKEMTISLPEKTFLSGNVLLSQRFADLLGYYNKKKIDIKQAWLFFLRFS